MIRLLKIVGRFTQTDPMPYGAGVAYESAFVYSGNRPTVMADPGGMRFGLANASGFNPVRSAPTPGRSSVSSSVRDFFAGLVKNVPRGFFKTWGTCGSVAAEIPFLAAGYSGCFVDDGNDISTISTVELPGGMGVLGAGFGAGSIISNARNSDDMGGEGICLDFGLKLAVGAGVELCIGLRRPAYDVDFTKLDDVKRSYSGVVSAYIYAAAGAGITVGLKEATSTVEVKWKYPGWIPHLLPKPLIPDFP